MVIKKTIDRNDLNEDGSLKISTPNYKTRDGDSIVDKSGTNNCYIVFGRDRQDIRGSGFGGKEHPRAGAMDIVVGLGGANSTSGQWLDPNMEIDAARIYISEKTNLDQYFNLRYRSKIPSLAAGSEEVEERSGIALKADAIRIIARESLRLVTRSDQKNSKDGDIPVLNGIDIIGNNQPDALQPMVKGDYLMETLKEMNENLLNVAKTLEKFLEIQTGINLNIMMHTHISPFFGIPTPPSDLLLSQMPLSCTRLVEEGHTKMLQFEAANKLFKTQYLNSNGSRYCLSKLNRVN